MSCTINPLDKTDKRTKVLQRLRDRRSRSRRSEVLVGVHLLELKKTGQITDSEFDYVMGITSTLETLKPQKME